MAHRFVTHGQLAKLAGQDFEIMCLPQVCGAHRLLFRFVEDGSILAIGIRSNGKTTHQIFLVPGDTLGYDCGEVWRVKKPAEYSDQIRGACISAAASGG